MRIFHTKKHFTVFFMPGFLLGIVYVNLVLRQAELDSSLFSSYFLHQYDSVKIVAEEYLWYLFKIRVSPLLLLTGLSFTKVRKIAVLLFLGWTGFTCGMLHSMAVLSAGIKGSILCLVGLFPQFILYTPAYLLLLWYCYTFPRNKWNLQKGIFVVVAVLAGILLEMYVNPMIMKAYLSTL